MLGEGFRVQQGWKGLLTLGNNTGEGFRDFEGWRVGFRDHAGGRD
jgi:hypothetical protein